MNKHMKRRYLPALLAVSLASVTLLAQEETVGGDTLIYKAVEELPRFPGCENLDTTIAVKRQCAEASLLDFIYSNIDYPAQARRDGIEGTVVLSFVVETDGTVSNLQVLRDIGGGCAAEAMRVVGAMNRIGVRWTPGKQNGEPVRVQFNLPIRFKLEDPLPYEMIGPDTVYVEFDTPLAYRKGEEALTAFLDSVLTYPEIGNDSCLVGDMDVKMLVQPNGSIKVLNVNDFNNLGFDFQFEAIRACNSTWGQWAPAVYQGRPVPADFDVNLTFLPTAPACKQQVDKFERANQLAYEGLELYNAEEAEAGLAKLDEAIELFPQNANYRYMRGQALLNENRLEEACGDFQIVREVLSTSYVDNLLLIICK